MALTRIGECGLCGGTVWMREDGSHDHNCAVRVYTQAPARPVSQADGDGGDE